MKKNELISLLELEDLSPDMRLIADESGIETVKELFKTCDGLEIRIPRINYCKSLLVKYIESRKGVSIKKIAREVDRSPKEIQKIQKELIMLAKPRAKASN